MLCLLRRAAAHALRLVFRSYLVSIGASFAVPGSFPFQCAFCVLASLDFYSCRLSWLDFYSSRQSAPAA